jgi:integrase
MAKRGLTDVAIRALKPGRYEGKGKDKVFVEGPWRREVPDGAARGLFHIVQPNGRLAACVRFRFDGRPCKLTLPPGLTLAAKRTAAAKAWEDIEHGRNPAVTKREATEKAALAKADTLASVVAEYFKRDGAKLRSRDVQERMLRNHVYPVLGARPIGSIKRKDMVRLLDKIEDGSGVCAADRTLAYLRRILNWHAVRDDEYTSPIVRGMARVKPGERARSRILSDAELAAVWTTACAAPGPFPALVRVLLLTAARRSEAAHLEWSELTNNGDWVLPAARNKTKQDLLRPLSAAARHVVAEMLNQQIDGCKYVFSTDGKHPISGYSRFKKRFDAACGVTSYTLHDLRRSARSLMSRAGVPSEHAERCLGHVLRGIVGVYDRHEYYREKQLAFEKLAELIEQIVNPQDNVVALRR